MKSPNTLSPPEPKMFKKWLRRCIFELETTPVVISRRAEVGVNTTGSFLREDRDIRLGVAFKLHAAVTDMAAESGKKLPTVQEVCRHA